MCAFLTVAAAAGQVPAPAQPPRGGIAIKVVEGNGAINSIRLRRAFDPVVEVVDSSGEPVQNATVTFLLPATGPGGTFGDNGLSVTMQTDQRGRAATHGLRPNGIAGRFSIRVTASWHGQAAAAEVTGINAEPVQKSHRSRTIAILAAIGGGAAVGAVIAAGHGGGSPASSPSGSAAGTGVGATIAPGTPSLGPPR